MQPGRCNRSVNIFLGTTASYAGAELMVGLSSLSPTARGRVALLFVDTQGELQPDVQAMLESHQTAFSDACCRSLRIAVPMGFAYAQRVDQHDGGRESHTFIGHFVPAGSGGIRNSGHVAAVTNVGALQYAIEAAVSAAASVTPDSQPDLPAVVTFNVVAFLGCATGGGALPAILGMIHRVSALISAQRPHIALYGLLPIGDDMPRFATRVKRANSAAALLELIAVELACTGSPGHHYSIWLCQEEVSIRSKLADETYLIGEFDGQQFWHGSDIARSVGTWLFQQIAGRTDTVHEQTNIWTTLHESMMDDYLEMQSAWESDRSLRPLHISDEMERLCTDPNALPYLDDNGQEHRIPLFKQVMCGIDRS